MSKRRVVITGLGWVTSLGLEVEKVFQLLTDGTSGVRSISRFDTSEYTSKIGGEILDEDMPNVEKRDAKRLDRFALFALNAAVDAVSDSGLDFSRESPERAGVIVGSGVGGMEEFAAGHTKLVNGGPSRVSPFVVPKLMVNAASGNISIRYGMMGPNSAVATACASAGHAIGGAFDTIVADHADIMVTGGSEAAVTPLGLACFTALRALSCRNDDPQAASRPFEKERDGFILAEGAGILVLEEYEHARQRGAKIYAEVAGYGQSGDAHHITAPEERGRGASLAMKNALRNARLNTTDINYINAHGTSTQMGDIAETRAVKTTFGDHVANLPVSSTKSMMGHLLGASGGVEAIITAKTIETGIMCPTINLHEPDDECDLDYVPHTARHADIRAAMSNSFGFGGHNVSLILTKV